MRILLAPALAMTLCAQTVTTLIGTGKPGFDERNVNNGYLDRTPPEGSGQ